MGWFGHRRACACRFALALLSIPCVGGIARGEDMPMDHSKMEMDHSRMDHAMPDHSGSTPQSAAKKTGLQQAKPAGHAAHAAHAIPQGSKSRGPKSHGATSHGAMDHGAMEHGAAGHG